jgi:CHAD domain-containing protein
MRAVAQLSTAPGSGSPSPAVSSRSPGHSVHRLARSLRQQWKRYRRDLKHCQHKYSAKAIHSFRVETRRLLSSLELLSGFLPARRVEKAQRLLKRHLDVFADLRDTQVQLAAVRGIRRAFPAARRFHAWLREREQRFAKQAFKNIGKVKAARLGKLIAASGEDVEEQLRGSLRRKVLAALLRAVDRAFRRAQQGRAGIDASDPWTIHRTRVAFKKFRYMVEALAEPLPEITGERLAAMHHYQTMMGEIQDAEMLLQTLDKFLSKQQIEAAAAQRFRAGLWRRRQRLIRAYLKKADQLREFWPLPESRAGISPRGSRAGVGAES